MMKYILSVLIQNQQTMECFDTEKELLARAGSLGAGDKAEYAFSVTYAGVLTRHKIEFTDRLTLQTVGGKANG